ncbi:MAG: DUF2764 family protein [Spirochaetales bacterium]|nr:DUF2764 family protein [Spirochaetales bacterium]
MSGYYYLVASLPFLSYEMDAGQPYEQFEETVKEQLSPEDFEIFKSIKGIEPDAEQCSHWFLEKWRVWEANLRNEMTLLRAKKKGVDGTVHLRDCVDDLSPRAVAKLAMQQETPLMAENFLNKSRWAYIEEIETGQFFNLENVLAHALKLKVLERKAKFSDDAGSNHYEKQVTAFRKIITDREEHSYGK